MVRVMIVDDHPTMVWGLEQLIASQAHMQVVATAGRIEEAIDQGRHHQQADQHQQPRLLHQENERGVDRLHGWAFPWEKL
jgi:CheY-like chemotaxis protein